MKVWDEAADFKELVFADKDITDKLSVEEIERVFSFEHYLRNVGKVFERVFGKN